MSIKILIKETDSLGRVEYRDCIVTSSKLEKKLYSSNPDAIVEIYGGEWDNRITDAESIFEANMKRANRVLKEVISK
jgi:hypothetical protein